MKRFVVVENPPRGARGARGIPAFRPVVFSRKRGARNSVSYSTSSLPATTALNRPRKRSRRNVLPIAPTTALNRPRLSRSQIEKLGYRQCLTASAGRRFKSAPRCRTKVAKKISAAAKKSQRLANLMKARQAQADKRALTGYGDAMGAIQTNSGRRRVRVVPIFSVNSRSRKRSGVSSRRGHPRKHGGRKMATAKQLAARRLFAKRAKSGVWKKRTRRKARRNTRGVPFSGKRYRPSLPRSGGIKVVVKAVRRKYRKALRKSRAHRARAGIARPKNRRKAKKNPVYTVFNPRRKRRKARRNRRRLSSGRARSLAMRRWHSSKGRRRGRRRARRNFGGGILASLKSALSLGTVKAGLAVLAGAVVATGAPSLLASWNTGWTGMGLSVLAAAGAAVAAKFFAPALFTEVASGGIVVVGLRLVAQFMPRALSWGTMSGFLLPATNQSGRSGVGRVAGYLPPPPGAVSLVGRGRVSGFARAAGEGFKSPRI